MSDKKNDFFTISIIAVILLLFSLADLLTKFGLVGDGDMPSPMEVVAVSDVSFQSGALFRDYENWEQNYFYNRSKWEKIVQGARIFLGRREIGGIYLGKHGRYFEKHARGDYSEETVQRALADLGELAATRNAKVMLIPTSDELWKKDLPSYADSFDQRAFLRRVQTLVGEEAYVDLYSVLREHAGEKIYYSTDPHWTTLAAYYGYLAWREQSEGELAYYYDLAKMTTVTEDFVGEYPQRTNLEMEEEEIQAFRETYRNPVGIVFDGELTSESYYRPELLHSSQPLDYFLGNDHSLVEITTGRDRDKSLVVIGDSYANVMIPLFAPHFEKIYVLNVERLQGDWKQAWRELMDKEGLNGEGELEVLLLQSVPGFLDLYAPKGDDSP